MLHHFSSSEHQTGQGAITADELNEIIETYGQGRIISADLWQKKARESILKDEICLTFDDALLSQYEVALPVLEAHNLTAFWFIYSSILEGELEMLEIYRKYRTSHFPSISKFYNAFFSTIQSSELKSVVDSSLKKYDKSNYLKQFTFYSDSDKKFRYTRDVALGVDNYNKVMHIMLKKDHINLAAFSKDLWLRSSQVKELASKNHIIGLHSHTHPTALSNSSYTQQKNEYSKNNAILTKLTGSKITSMGHPNNSYNSDTLNILSDLEITVGFCSNMSKLNHGNLEFPRIDHSIIMKEIKHK